jgi:hypothetical protein
MENSLKHLIPFRLLYLLHINAMQLSCVCIAGDEGPEMEVSGTFPVVFISIDGIRGERRNALLGERMLGV